MSKAPALATEISHVVGLDSTHTPAPERSPDDPVDTHESHPDWQWPTDPHPHTRWLECVACGIRDYYPGAASPCAVREGAAAKAPVTLASALARLRLDIEAFEAWWRARPSLGSERPTLEEWRAEYLEWAKGPRA